jgi:chaperonin GroEL (HSP60 family)
MSGTTVILRQWHNGWFSVVQVSIILRGANDFILDEINRSLHDALCIVKRTLESNMVTLLVPFLVICSRNK